jgi:O-antigen/teichoic acid export membrane protein
VVAILTTAGAAVGVMRFYFKSDDPAYRHRIIATANIIMFALGAVGALLLAAGAPWLWRNFLGSGGAAWFLYLSAATFLFESLMTVPLAQLQAEGRAATYAIVLLVKLVLQLTLNILLLVVLDAGVAGVLISTVIATGTIGLVLAGWSIRRSGLGWDRAAARDLRRFGLPYQFVTAGTFILAFGDRYLLQRFQSTDVVGVYALAYQFGFLLVGLGATPFTRAWQPVRFSLLHLPEAERERRDNRGFLFLNLLLVSLAVAMAVFIRPFLRVMTTADYVVAGQYVPIILLAYLCQVWNDVVSFGAQAAERTELVTISTWVAVVSIVALYLLLIPPFGAMGAAVATLISFLVRFATQYVLSHRVRPIRYRWGPTLAMLAAGAIATMISRALPEHLWIELGANSALYLLYLVFVWRAVLSTPERLELRGKAVAALARVRPATRTAER